MCSLSVSRFCGLATPRNTIRVQKSNAALLGIDDVTLTRLNYVVILAKRFALTAHILMSIHIAKVFYDLA